MTINISKNPIKKIKDVAFVLTPSAFMKKYKNYADAGEGLELLLVPSRYDPQKFEAALMEGNILPNGTAVIPKVEQLDIVYLGAYLNSYPGRLLLSNNHINENVQISANTIGNLPIRMVNSNIQTAFGMLHLLVYYLQEEVKDQDNDRYLKYKIQLFSELRDAVAMQLMIPRLYSTFNIDVLGRWMDLLCFNNELKSNNNHVEMAKIITELLLDPTNPTMNELKKLRVVLDIITKKLKDKK